jgi:plastocyanin
MRMPTQEPVDDVDFDEDRDAYLDSEDYDVLFLMDGGMFWFEVDGVRNPNITVNQGDRVRIEFTSVEGRHDVVIDELDVRSELIDADGSTVVEFVADTIGEFDYYCSYMRHREMGMVGRFIVV